MDKPGNVAKLRKALIRIRDYKCVSLAEHNRIASNALLAPPRNCDKPEFSTPEQALAALKERFPIEAYFPGFKMAAEWLLDAQDYCIAEPVSRRFGQQPKEGDE